MQMTQATRATIKAHVSSHDRRQPGRSGKRKSAWSRTSRTRTDQQFVVLKVGSTGDETP